MGVLYLIIGLIALWILRSIAVNQTTIAKNQVGIGKILLEIRNEISKNS